MIVMGMGRRQVVRHLVLVQTFAGSNPSAPDLIFWITFGKILLYPELCNMTFLFRQDF